MRLILPFLESLLYRNREGNIGKLDAENLNKSWYHNLLHSIESCRMLLLIVLLSQMQSKQKGLAGHYL